MVRCRIIPKYTALESGILSFPWYVLVIMLSFPKMLIVYAACIERKVFSIDDPKRYSSARDMLQECTTVDSTALTETLLRAQP